MATSALAGAAETNVPSGVSADGLRARRPLSSSTKASETEQSTTGNLALKEIPGSYGLPYIGSLRDRLDFTIFQQTPGFYTARRDKYKSTVFRSNVAPGPPFFPDSRAIVLIDAKSFPILFDVAKVAKKDTFYGTYVPNLKFTGGYRVVSLMDPSEPKHEPLKKFSFEILKRSGVRVLPEIIASISDIPSDWETTIAKNGKVSYESSLQEGTFQFMIKSFIGRDPYEPGINSIGKKGPMICLLWDLAQIAPVTVSSEVPWFILPFMELFLHTFPIPWFLIKLPYSMMVKFFRTYSVDLLDFAEKQLGLDREEALHNLIHITILNSWAPVKLLYPKIIRRLGSTSSEYQKELSAEVTRVLKSHGGKIDSKSLAAMPMVESAAYEVLRMDPPVPYQYATAKEDFMIESHDAAFQVKKGETLMGYSPLAGSDPKYFKDGDSYLPKRFMGEEGRALLKYLFWSNGRQSVKPTLSDKQCPGTHFSPLVMQAFIAILYSKYETLRVDENDPNSLIFMQRRQAE